MRRVGSLLLLVGWFAGVLTVASARSQEAPAGAEPVAAVKPDPTGGATGDKTVLGEDPKLPQVELDASHPSPKDDATNKSIAYLNLVADAVGKNRVAINMVWILITGYLVMFMQAGFALVETGLTRAKNVAHTMSMNIMIYGIGVLGFWVCGFAIMFGGFGPFANLAGGDLLNQEFTINLFGKPFGLFGHEGFFLSGRAFDVGLLALFLFQMVFMDTAATIPTGALAERWKFLAFCVYGVFISTIIYPVYGNWVWGSGWLAKLGANFGMGHGHVDFAGSSVVHMVGGVTALAGVRILGPRIGKYNKDGSVNVLPAHNVPMYVLGTLILAFGWFGFNPGSTLAGADLNIARIATNTMLASAAGAVASMILMWILYKKPDPSFMCNGMLAGLVAITAPCAFVAPWAAVLIGGIAGVIVVYSCFFFERVLKIDDPVGAVSVHGVNGAWGVLALGLFADGSYGQGWNGSFWYKMADGSLQWYAEKLKELPAGAAEQGVTGLFYGNPSQFLAEAVGVAANLLWVLPVALLCFWIIEKLIGNRVTAEVETQGLDVPELGVPGYISEDPKAPESHVLHPSAEPRPAFVPPDGHDRYTLVVEGVTPKLLADVWSGLCQPGDRAPADEFRAIYPHMTTIQGTRFRFRGGNPETMRTNLQKLLKGRAGNGEVKIALEK